MSRHAIPIQTKRACEICFLAAIFVLPFAKAGFEILFGLALFFWISEKIMNHGSFSEEHAFFILVGLFVISSSISALNSDYPELCLRGIIKLIKYLLVMLVAADLFTNLKNLKRLLVVGLISFGLVILEAVIQNVLGRGFIMGYSLQFANERIRLTGPYQSYGLLAAHIIAFLTILLALATSSVRYKRIAWGILVLIALYILYGTQSRGGWLAAFSALIIYGLSTRDKWFLIILILIVLISLFVLPKRVLFHKDAFDQEQSIVERKLLWKRAISVIRARPWFGCGINTYTKNYPRYTQGKEWSLIEQEAMKNKYAHFGKQHSWRIPGHPSQIPGHYVHNGYLQLAAETGLVSLAFFLAIIGFSFSSGFRALKKASKDKKLIIIGLICGLIALLLQAFVDTTLHNTQSAVLIWLFMGLLVSVGSIASNSGHKPYLKQ